MSVLTSYTHVAMPWQTIFHGVVVPIKSIWKNYFEKYTEIPTPTLEDFKKKLQTRLSDILDEWYLNNMRNHKPPTNNLILSKK